MSAAHTAVLRELVDADGAILCWQVSDRAAFESALADGAIRFAADDDLYVHPDAHTEGDGAYFMTAGPCPKCASPLTECLNGTTCGMDVAYRECNTCSHQWDQT